ncbi:hypothetical protein LHA31_12410 (plasmid) [Carnobacterium viridans]|uniref:Uncharacterized protein n=1 Tax=Carnobacterium viridans TaxID=174587 RepID=A0A1H1CJ46_9LACT|nr:hypothetical protein [Carnobacterium viridans]UDE96355.1 hypothetical protein LHA31_12150 [Carnobacterium viridans]UDE96448.1 hypothetical protein LHA31_12410 [Carnobacterium viridans]SDQ02600.1 hypothetical protein SAMN04487752_0114 [Carnobacterium viridans]SDQ64148.1 hypothetical protein SAMN04487752_2759 [Carnobacterium viridans]SDQ64699.1 hypothetical protein SAMN04487752_2781 [Carnobacterium viridans]
MGLFFMKLMWRILPVLSVLVVLGCSYLIWRVKLHQWWNSGHLKRVSLVSLTSLVLCFSVLLLLGYSTQSKLPFGSKIQEISAQQQTVKEQKQAIEAEKVATEEKDDQIEEKLEAALDVADKERIYLTNKNESTIITEDWFLENKQLIDQLSEDTDREEYTNRFKSVRDVFLN